MDKYEALKNRNEIKIRYPWNNKIIPMYVYQTSGSTSICWTIKIRSNEIDPFEIHERLIESFGDLVETGLQIGSISERFIYQYLNFPIAFNFLSPTIDEELKRFSSDGNLQIKKNPERKGGRKLFIKTSGRSIYTDYPKNKITGNLVDFTKFAPQNREAFNSGFAKFLKAIDGVVTDWEPKQGIYPNPDALRKYKNENDWLAEEIDQYWYKALSERKEEYEKQQTEKPGFLARLFRTNNVP